jgi:hypothetical protein
MYSSQVNNLGIGNTRPVPQWYVPSQQQQIYKQQIYKQPLPLPKKNNLLHTLDNEKKQLQNIKQNDKKQQYLKKVLKFQQQLQSNSIYKSSGCQSCRGK